MPFRVDMTEFINVWRHVLQWLLVVVAFEWTWDSENKSAAADLTPGDREVRFHINYSSGTAAIRGTHVMADRQYFWEVKMTTPVYGTDMVTCLLVFARAVKRTSINWCSFVKAMIDYQNK